MHLALIGGGVLGATLALRLARAGQRVTLYEAAPSLGGLAGSQDYGEFHWDRFYHCVLPGDRRVIGLLEDLGEAGRLRWKRTGTGYYRDGRCHAMSGNVDFLRYPHLGPIAKARLASLVTVAARHPRPERLHRVTAKAWLTRHCGRRGYEEFWAPLLRAKFGPYHDEVAAVFIWATLTRLFGARQARDHSEELGYIQGGYMGVLASLERTLRLAGVQLRLGARVESIETSGAGCRVRTATGEAEYAQVVATVPSPVLGKVLGDTLQPTLRLHEAQNPSARSHLGVVCLTLVLDHPLTPFYVLNIGEPGLPLTGVIEMSNLTDASTESAGRTLVYLPRYLPSEDVHLRSDEMWRDRLLNHGLRRIFPDLRHDAIRYAEVHRARYVQALPLAREDVPARPTHQLQRPLHILNSSQLRAATLNNDEILGLVDDFAAANPALFVPSERAA